MSDLFGHQPEPAPAYGTLSASDERALYDTKRSAWIRYVAARHADLIVSGGPKWAAWAWPLMSEDLRRAVWQLLDEGTRAVVRTVRSATA